MRNLVVAGMLLGSCLLLAGCSRGPKLVIARGKLTVDQKPLELPAKTQLSLKFIPVEKGTDKEWYVGNYRQDGNFNVTGKRGDGLPVGKYQVAVEIHPAKTDQIKEFNKRFSEKNTQVTCEITSEEPITIDFPGPGPK